MRSYIFSVLIFFSFTVKPEVSDLDQLSDEYSPQHKKVSTPCFTKLLAQALETCSLLVDGDATITGETTIGGATTIKNDTIIEGDLIVNGEIFCNSQPICSGGGGTEGSEGSEGTEPEGSGTGGGGGFTSSDYLFAVYNAPTVLLAPNTNFVPNLEPVYLDGWQDGTEVGTFIVPTSALYHISYHVNYGIYFVDNPSQKNEYEMRILFEVDGVSVLDARRIVNEYYNPFELAHLAWASTFRSTSSSVFVSLSAGSRVRLHIFNDASISDGSTLNFANPPNVGNFTTPPPYATLTITKIADL